MGERKKVIEGLNFCGSNFFIDKMSFVGLSMGGDINEVDGIGFGGGVGGIGVKNVNGLSRVGGFCGSVLYSSNKPGFIDRDINNSVNRVLDANFLKGGYEKK